MLLGSEYELLSYISSVYNRHRDGYLRFSEEDFRGRFPDKESQVYLRRLESKELVVFRDGFILVDSIKWSEFFSCKLNESLNNIDESLFCKFNKELDIIEIFQDENMKISLTLRYNENEHDKVKDVVSMHFLTDSDNDLFWLDLLNDTNLINMLYSYIIKEISSLNYKHRLMFSFFEGLEEEYISEIFNKSIKDYFIQGGGKTESLSSETIQILRKYMRKDNPNAYQICLRGINLIISKNERSIEFYVLNGDKLVYPIEISREIDKLQEKLLNKVSEYRKLTLFVKNKVVENSTKLITLVSVILSPLSVVLCILTTLGVKFLSGLGNNVYNVYIVGGSGILLVILYILIFKLIYIPAIRLSKFSWQIHYK